VDTSLRSLAVCLGATFITGAPTDGIEHLHLFIGAMREESFTSRIEGYDPASLLIMTGDRRSIQQAAIEKGVRLLVVTGGLGSATTSWPRPGRTGSPFSRHCSIRLPLHH